MRIASDGKVGINESDPTAYYADNLVVKAPSEGGITIGASANSHTNYLMFAESASSGAAGYRGYIGYYHNATTTSGRMALSSQGYMTFLTSSGERMRIDSSGNMMVGKTAVGAATLGAEMRPDGFVGSAKASSVNGSITFGAYSTTASQYQFYVGMAGTIYARATSISSLSDERRKENIVDLETGLPEVMALKPRRFDWKDGSETNVAGFIAQEVETVLPDLIGEWEDENNDDLKSVKMGDMLPTLVKAIQEQQEQIEQLKTEIQTLKGE